MDGEKGEKPQSSGSKFTCISGAQHVIVSRKTLFQVVLLMVAAFVGTIVAENLRLHHNSTKLKDSRGAMKGTNMRLKAEKDDYKARAPAGPARRRPATARAPRAEPLQADVEPADDWKAAHDLSLEAQKTRITSFKESSEALMLGLDDVRTVLEEKEFQLWEKEGLLEYQEERLLDSEDQEPYYGQERAHTDDAPNDDAIRRRRRLRAKAPLPAGVTGRVHRAPPRAQGRKGRAA
ncbi:hypothetical protein SO694_000134124 [Aureococcus anophagefferens]|uniref:Uncharacterized protein n=1 Tax=Aureococcus anophagefferens TaxID=44056 RepID=A0ABR1G1U2_AURAN